MRNYWGSVLSLVIGVVLGVVPMLLTDLPWWFYVLVALATVTAIVLLWPKQRESAPAPAPEAPKGAFLYGNQKGNKHTGSVDTDAPFVYRGDAENTEFGAKVKQRRRK